MDNRQTSVMGRTQSGATLIMTLMILLIVSLLAISSAERTTLQDRMVGAQRDADIAFEMAEEALREAERKLMDGSITLGDFNDSGPFYSAGKAPDPFKRNLWKEDSSSVATATATRDKWAADFDKIKAPLFFIERVGDLPKTAQPGDVMVTGREDLLGEVSAGKGLRVVAQAFGASGNSSRILEAYFGADLRD
ncbi:MAG: hypothetical protein EA349_12545 [Halomonadaceae bacterium]|nr:MAG: hypothetical protein EA349_12545 [Halomonadaceae bacterium]